MALTKNVPVSNSKFIARYFRYTEEENIEFKAKLSENQIIIDVPHVSTSVLAHIYLALLPLTRKWQ